MIRVSLLIVVIAAAACGADWPQWRGPGRDGVWPEKNFPARLPADAKPKWRTPIGGGYSGIAVVAGKAYTLDYQRKPREIERVLCLEAATGKPLWTHSYEVAYEKMDYGNGPRCTPTVRDGKVYTLGAHGHLFCLDASSGKVLWQHDCVKEFKGRVPTWGYSCSPFVDEDRVLVQIGGLPDAGMVAFHADTGKEVWRSLGDRPGYSSPISIAGKGWRQIAYFTPQALVGLEPKTGKELWRLPVEEEISYDVAIADVIYHDGVLLTSDYWTGCRAVRLDENGRNPKLLWKGKQVSLLMSTPLWRDGHIYALDRSRGLKCIELATGKVKWDGADVAARGQNPQAALVWIDERVLIFNEKCQLILARLTTNKYEEIGRLTILDKFVWAHPAFADGCLYFRDDTEIVCVPIVR